MNSELLPHMSAKESDRPSQYSVVVAVSVFLMLAGCAAAQQPSPAKIAPAENFSRLPLTFEANQGQSSSQAQYISRGSGYTLFLTADEAALKLTPPAGHKAGHRFGSTTPRSDVDKSDRFSGLLHMRLVGANSTAKITGLDEQPGKSNYFIGNDPSRWRTGIPNYAKVQYQSVYSGVDLVYYGNQRQLEYDFVVAPGADPKAIALEIAADPIPAQSHKSNALRITANGDLNISLPNGHVLLHKPLVYQTTSQP